MNRKQLKNNSDLAVNVKSFEGFLPNSKILVLKEFMPDIDDDMGGFHINDFFNAVIAETIEAAYSVTNPDFIIYDDPTPYRDNKLFIEKLKDFPNSIICTNHNSIRAFQKLGRPLEIYNINYLVASPGPTKKASVVQNVECGLCSDGPGVHLALILGASQIFYTGTSKIDYNFLVQHVEKKNAAVPVNIVRPKRGPILKTRL